MPLNPSRGLSPREAVAKWLEGYRRAKRGRATVELEAEIGSDDFRLWYNLPEGKQSVLVLLASARGGTPAMRAMTAAGSPKEIEEYTRQWRELEK